MIKHIIFDLDGVLLDSKEIHYNALNLALAEINPTFIIGLEDHLNKFDGLSTKKKMDILVRERDFPPNLVDIVCKSKQEYTSKLLESVKEDHEKQSIFKELKDKGYVISVASNAIHDTVQTCLYKLGLKPYVDRVFSNESVSRPKPASEIYLTACIWARVDPIETLIVEDSAIGRQGALASGCHLFAVKDAYSWNRDELFATIQGKGKTGKHMWDSNKLNVVIPMAGAGSRFELAGYTFPKPLIEVRGKPMIQLVVENLSLKANYIFIAQNSHIEKYNLKTLLNLIAPGCKLIGIDGVTQGAACTVLTAKEFIDNDNPLIIANSDQFIEWNSSDFYYSMEADKIIDGGIVTFKATHPKWSFAKIVDGFVDRIAEKNPISDDATVGIYYWKTGRNFVIAAETMISHNDRVNGEFYVAPVFNWAIAGGLKFKPYNVSKMFGLGTPEDLNSFLENYKGDL
jgi:beta-phosphoglucomutase-like phosphatase (HAD superfamily)/dTDP-glucose pyrophosphorylase